MAGEKFADTAMNYHRRKPPGKLAVVPTKPLATQRDLSLAYSPGVADACDAIAADPNLAASVTGRGNLVGVVTNATAVLGLGDIGPLGAKPVMEGKAVLFKKFADIDVFDIVHAETDYLIPKPFNPRLITEIASAVARAAMESGVATRPIANMDAYRQRLSEFVWRTGLLMKPVFDRAKLAPKRVAYTDGEEERELRTAQIVVDEGLAMPIRVVTPSITARGLFNITALAVVDAPAGERRKTLAEEDR